MKARMVAVLLGLAFSVSTAVAQDLVPAATAGSKALLFNFRGLDNLGAPAYNGGLGLKYYLSAPLALRATLIFGTGSEKILTTLENGGKDGSRSYLTLGLVAGGEYHLTMNRVSPYIGGELMYSMTGTREESAINIANTNATIIENNENGTLGSTAATRLGFGGIGGVEFFVTKEISLSAEYKLGYTLSMRPDMKTTENIAGVKVETTKSFSSRSDFVISNGGTLTIAVYF